MVSKFNLDLEKMADTEKDVQGVAELLAKTKVDQVNIVSFKGRSLKLDSSDDGELFLAVNLLKQQCQTWEFCIHLEENMSDSLYCIFPSFSCRGCQCY